MSGPAISDHALLRFLERGGELDVEGLRQTLSDSLARAHQAALAMGETEYLVKVGNSTFVVRNGTVTTVLPAQNPCSQAHQLGRPVK